MNRMESDLNAEGFYLRMGAVRVGSALTFIDGQCRVLPMLHHLFSSPEGEEAVSHRACA